MIALYTIRSERHLADQLGYNTLFRWFLGWDVVEAPCDASTFSQNRERLTKHQAAEQCRKAPPAHALLERPLLAKTGRSAL